MGTKWEQEPQIGARMGTKWPKVKTRMGTQWKQETEKGTRMGTKWERSENKNRKVGQQEPQSGTRNSGNRNPFLSHFGVLVPTLFPFLSNLGFLFLLYSHSCPFWDSCSHFVPTLLLGFLFGVLVPTLFPFLSHFGVLVPTLFLFLSRFGVLFSTLFPLCSHSCPTSGFSFPLCSHFFLLWGSCSHFVSILVPLWDLVPNLFLVPILVPLWASCFHFVPTSLGFRV